MRPSGDRAGFRREGRLLATLNHPGVVPVLDAGEDRGLASITMPVISAPTLDAFLTSPSAPGRSGAQRLAARMVYSNSGI